MTYTIGKPWLSGFRNGMALNRLHQENWRNSGLNKDNPFLLYTPHNGPTIKMHQFVSQNQPFGQKLLFLRVNMYFQISFKHSNKKCNCLLELEKILTNAHSKTYRVTVMSMWYGKNHERIPQKCQFLQFFWCNPFKDIPFRNPESQGFPMVYVTLHDSSTRVFPITITVC